MSASPVQSPKSIATTSSATSLSQQEISSKDIQHRPDLVDWSIFNEILAMDEDEDSFSSNLFLNFCDQADSIFAKIDEALSRHDLTALNNLGHYIKGSAASLGLVKIQKSCEKIQNYGARRNLDVFNTGGRENDDFYLRLINETLQQVRNEFEETKLFLTKYLGIEDQLRSVVNDSTTTTTISTNNDTNIGEATTA